MTAPTIKDLITALQQYPEDTPVIGTCNQTVSNVLSITGAYPEYEDRKLVKLDNVLISFWDQSCRNEQILGRVPEQEI